MSTEIPKLSQDDPSAGESVLSDAVDSISDVSKIVASGVSMLGLVEKTVLFLLYTQSNTEKPYFLKFGDVDNLNKSPFDPASETKIIIHGYGDTAFLDPYLHCLKMNYLKKKNYNIIMVDWTLLNKNEAYLVMEMARLVGEFIGKMVKFLHDEGGQSWLNVHIIGHSLGGHVAGFAGKYNSGLVGRITGLDIAGITYEIPRLKDPEDRLDKMDAVFVDVIHTSAGIIGITAPVGHADFYPNKGTIPQPECVLPPAVVCSHVSAVVFMYNSIKYPDRFDAVECDSWENYENGSCSDNSISKMGEYADRNARGKYYLKTSPSVDLC
ncbi:hypothetical protein PV328_004621 [Microctonus aethiopoides]|uniref:phospholipase A1 n=1 Tax=Microctonus aethiopoides TaxID=144406 RepID=A0AA39KLU0_9HYME|nr:hypothetical protein PV328_004621 [Microctonus aethiopoides]